MGGSSSRLRHVRAPLRWLDAALPRPEDLLPALVAALIGLLPLVAARLWLGAQDPAATATDLWRLSLGEIQAWSIVAFLSALALRHAPGRARPVIRFGVHAFATILLLLSVVEIVFFAVTGGRVDMEVLAFAYEDAPQVAPVFLSEVQGWHLAMVATVVGIGVAPALLRFRPRPAWVGRLSVLLVVLPLVIEGNARPRPRKSLRILQPSLVEQLWWDGLERIGDETVAPGPAELEPIRLVRTGERSPPNVVLVLLESTGARATTMHDPTLDTTPNLAALAKDGWWVRNAYSVVPHTSKSIVTTMCGTWPQLVSEIREASVGGLPDRCLPGLLKELGYRTAFFQTADERFESRGSLVYHMGFDLFRSRDTLRGPPFEPVNYFGVEDRAMLAPGLAWSTQDDRPFFATYLTLTSHHDYGTPSHWEKRTYPAYKERQQQYLNAVRYVDDFVGRLVESYRQAGLLDNTLFVILGDHGEAFGEHGRSMHDLVIYEEGLHIPMVLYGPGVLEGTGTIEGPRQQIDVVPTILELLGVKAEGGFLPGRSLFSAAEDTRALLHSCWRSHRCLARREAGVKVIDHYRDAAMQRFDLRADPLEKTDLREAVPADSLEAVGAELRAWRARVNGRYQAVRDRALAARQVADASPALATWGGKMDLLGCEIRTPEVLPAEAVWLRCRWRTNEQLRQAWRLDLRLEGGFSPVVTDVKPLDGLLPTFKWTPGLAVTDDVRVFVPPDATPGPADVFVGWERYGDGVIDMEGPGEDRFQVGTVTVLPPLYPYQGKDDAAVDEVPSQDPAPGSAGAAVGPEKGP